MRTSLDGLTGLRDAHSYEAHGGIEQYLTDLNQCLLSRNSFFTIQVQLTSNPSRVGEREERVALRG